MALTGEAAGCVGFRALLASTVAGDRSRKGLAQVQIDPLAPFDPDRTKVTPLECDYELIARPRRLRASGRRGVNEHGQTVCLNMIVRNEAHVIERCLRSVLPIIDSWAIVDTGSTDGTQDRIRELLAGLPGELIERPWVNFAHNRTEAIAHAGRRGDYFFVIDADEVVELEPRFALPHLSAGAYIVEVAFHGCVYPRRQLVRSDLPGATPASCTSTSSAKSRTPRPS